ncbi:MAG: FAD-dependent oxidoreductase, partial [Chloroflexota bacterium]
RSRDGQLQPVTPLFILSNVDLECAQQHSVTRLPYEIVGSASWRDQCGSFRVNLAPWVDELGALFPHFHLAQFNIWVLGDGVFYAGNMIHLAGIDASDADLLSRVEADSRKLVWELGEFARSRIPGFEQAHIVSTMPYIGVRETRRLVGEYTLDYDDVVEARRFEDVVALCGYRVDIHGYDGGPVYDEPERGTQVKDYGSYDIPYRSLVPKQIENLLVAGRSLSASHEAQGSARVMGTCMAMGHATGTAAALAAQQGVAPREVDVHLLQQTILQQGGFLGEALAPLKPTPIPRRPVSR